MALQLQLIKLGCLSEYIFLPNNSWALAFTNCHCNARTFLYEESASGGLDDCGLDNQIPKVQAEFLGSGLTQAQFLKLELSSGSIARLFSPLAKIKGLLKILAG